MVRTYVVPILTANMVNHSKQDYCKCPKISNTEVSGKMDYANSADLDQFVCVEVLRPSQPNGVMLSAVSLLNHTFTRQAYSSKRLTSIVHILSPETDNCPS